MFESFIVEGTSLEKKVQKLIKKNGYAMFNDGQGRLLSVTDIDDGIAYGMTNDDEDEYVDLSGDSQRWFLEGTVASDVAQSTGKLEKKILRKPLDDEEDEDDITEASDKQAIELVDDALDLVQGGKVDSFKWMKAMKKAQAEAKSSKLKNAIEDAKDAIHGDSNKAFWLASRIVSGKLSEASDDVTEALMDAAIDGGIAVLGSFEDRDVMTRDAGFEMNYKNKVYQVTITQSR